MQFEFDEAKNRANIRKHGLSLEFAGQVLEDPDKIEIVDDRKDYGETRIICFGLAPARSICGRVFVVVYTLRKEKTRVISLRKANVREQNYYYRH